MPRALPQGIFLNFRVGGSLFLPAVIPVFFIAIPSVFSVVAVVALPPVAVLLAVDLVQYNAKEPGTAALKLAHRVSDLPLVRGAAFHHQNVGVAPGATMSNSKKNVVTFPPRCARMPCKKHLEGIPMEKQPAARQITEGVIWKQILVFFFPILLGTFFQQMYNTVDTIIVGRFVSTQALAAVGTTGPLVNMINGFFTGLSSGATVILAQFYGAENRDGVRRAMHTGITLSLILGVTITVLGCGFGPTVLEWMKTPAECIGDASLYVRIYFAGAVASMLYNMEAGILRAMGDSRRPVLSLIAACLVNIVMDIVLVVGLRMGVAGAALATVFSQIVSAAMLLVILLREKEDPLRLKELGIDGRLLGRILLIGVPAGLQMVMFDLSNTLIQSGVNSFGSVVMAAWTAYTKTDALTWMVSGAFGVAITTFVGQNYGAHKFGRVRQSVRVCLAMSIGTVGLISLVLVVLRRFIMGIYTEDAQVIETGAYIIGIIEPFAAAFMPVEIFAGTMRGMGDSVKPTAIVCLSVCVVRVLWLVTVVRRYHVLLMLCVCYPMTWVLASVVFLAVYLGYFRKKYLLEATPA